MFYIFPPISFKIILSMFTFSIRVTQSVSCDQWLRRQTLGNTSEKLLNMLSPICSFIGLSPPWPIYQWLIETMPWFKDMKDEYSWKESREDWCEMKQKIWKIWIFLNWNSVEAGHRLSQCWENVALKHWYNKTMWIINNFREIHHKERITEI